MGVIHWACLVLDNLRALRCSPERWERLLMFLPPAPSQPRDLANQCAPLGGANIPSRSLPPPSHPTKAPATCTYPAYSYEHIHYKIEFLRQQNLARPHSTLQRRSLTDFATTQTASNDSSNPSTTANMGKVHGSLARAGKVKSQSKCRPWFKS
jgi:hypothetical protein